MVGAFKTLLSKDGDWRQRIDAFSFEVLEEIEARKLEGVFSEDEVFGALSELNGDKSLGSNGFSMAFWHFSWEFVKIEVLNFFNEFHEHGRFVRSLNATFWVLIPKTKGVDDLKDFRLIILVGGLYKLLAKVLANRLKKVVGKVVLKFQNAFMEGGQILDAVLMANEAVDSMLKKRDCGLLWELNIEKAYDHMN